MLLEVEKKYVAHKKNTNWKYVGQCKEWNSILTFYLDNTLIFGFVIK